MPFTERQRKYFNAAAARGEEGMRALASEANQLKKAGEERPPVDAHRAAFDAVAEKGRRPKK